MKVLFFSGRSSFSFSFSPSSPGKPPSHPSHSCGGGGGGGRAPPHRRGRPLPSGLSSDDVLERLHKYFVEEDPDFLNALRGPDTTSLSPSAFRLALRAAKEYRLGLWVRQQNMAGKAVRSSALIARYNGPATGSSLPRPLPQVPQTEFSTVRNWAMRWRRSQGDIFGQITTASAISRDEKRDGRRRSKTPLGDPIFIALWLARKIMP